MRAKGRAGFTIVEVLVVMAIILVLAGLVLATSSYVHNKGARSRAEAEIAAMSAAVENYKADNGVYPRGNVSASDTTKPYDTDKLYSTGSPTPHDDPAVATYTNASQVLYRLLSGDTDNNPSNGIEAAGYMQFKPSMLKPSTPGANTYIADSFGYSYGYSTAYQGDVDTNVTPPSHAYNPTFDLWSTAGGTAKPASQTEDQYRQSWIKNW
jgi:prepilin-type N-terminal cleavage/methylation domain-containing protein